MIKNCGLTFLFNKPAGSWNATPDVIFHGFVPLDSKLDTAVNALIDANFNDDGAAWNSLDAFINAVQAQRAKKIPSAQADELIALAQEIQDLARGRQLISSEKTFGHPVSTGTLARADPATRQPALVRRLQRGGANAASEPTMNGRRRGGAGVRCLAAAQRREPRRSGFYRGENRTSDDDLE